MNITHENYGHVTVLSLKGEFTADDVDGFQKNVAELMDHDARDFVVDMEKVPFIDSAALESLLDLRDKSSDALGMVKLAATDESVAKILEMTRLDQQFERFPDMIEAVKSFR
jgi:anti-anti-sigma factor